MHVAILTETNMSHENVYDGLSKELFKHKIDCFIMDYSYNWNAQILSNFNSVFDAFITIPHIQSIDKLCGWGADMSKIILIAHAPWELDDLINYRGIEYLNNFKKIASVSKEISNKYNIEYVQNGIVFDRYYLPPATEFKKLGYPYPIFNSHKWKRSYLSVDVSIELKYPVTSSLKPFHYRMSPSFYKNIDATVSFSNATEACGLTIMESAAAGRLPFSCDIGIVKSLGKSPGIILPLEDKELLSEFKTHLDYYSQNPKDFHIKCKESQEFAKEYYDWPKVVDQWINLITT